MTFAVKSCDPDTVRWHDHPGLRFTTCPPAPRFTEDFGEAELLAHARASNAALLPESLSLHVYLSCCFSPCLYPGGSRLSTSDATKAGRFLERLSREIETAATFFDRDREVHQVHLGGGLPKFLSAKQLAGLLRSLGRHFWLSLAADRDFSVELAPGHCSAQDIDILAGAGFNRASFGIQDFDPEVQKVTEGPQGVEETLTVLRACRRSGLRSVNVDLVCGLPRQKLAGFRRTIETLLGEVPDRFALCSYADSPHRLRAQPQVDEADLPDSEARLELRDMAMELLAGAGYEYIGLGLFARADDDLSQAMTGGGLRRNVLGYATHGECDLIGFGVGAVSQVADCYSQNFRDVVNWERAVDGGKLPVWRGVVLNFDDKVRQEVIQDLMCCGHIDKDLVEERFGIEFAAYFSLEIERLKHLAADGLVDIGERSITVTSQGRYRLRIIAMCFDHCRNSTSVVRLQPRA